MVRGVGTLAVACAVTMALLRFAPMADRTAHALTLTPDCTTATQIDDGAATWTIGPSLETLRNGQHAGGGVGTLYFFSGGSLYVRSLGLDWYRWNGTWWERYGAAQPGCGPSQAGPAFAYWNMQYGKGVRSAGVACSVANDAEYGTLGAGNAWGNGHIGAHLTHDIGDDPRVVAFGASEINAALPMNASAVLSHLGWAAKVERSDEALFARHGFVSTDSRTLTQCGPHQMHALYGQVWRDSARTDWVHVFSSHFVHPHVGSCSSGVQSDDVVQWMAEKATDGRPIVFMGDLNTVVENTDPVVHYRDHITRFTERGFVDAWRAVFPNPITHPGPTATWHGTDFNPLPNGTLADWAPWKRVDYVFAQHAPVVGVRRFNHDIGDPRTCAASDHTGIVATLGDTAGTPAPTGVPAPWAQRDVGLPGVGGYSAANGADLVAVGSGRDIWDHADAFQFVYQPLTGDGTIVARVAGIAGADPWRKAGVMLRSDLTADAAHAFLLVSGGRGLAFQRRTTTGGLSSHTDAGPGAAPAWVRLVRSGTLVTAFRSTDGRTWVEVGRDTIAWGSTVYAGLAVTSHDDSALAGALFEHAAVTAAAQPAPSAPPGGPASPWSHGDVGGPALPGSVTVDGGTVVVRGAGADVWGTADAFQFVHRSLTGDGAIVARVSGLDAWDPWAKAGVMIRQSLEPGAAHAFMLVTPANGLAFQRRTAGGGVTTHTAGGTGTVPIWLRLERTGDTVVASWSLTGTTWIEAGRDIVPMGSPVYVGLAVTSHDDSALASATFDNVSVIEGAANAWRSTDVGTVAARGAAAFAGGTAVVTGSGADIWDRADAFHYGYTQVSGDFDVTARILSLDHVHDWTKGGLMIRASLDPDDAHASLFATPGTGAAFAFQRRVARGDDSLHTGGPGAAPPAWLRLSRRGSTITASVRSSDTGPWTTIGDAWIPGLPPAPLVGLAVTSHADGVLAGSAFDNVLVTPVP